MKVNMKMQGNAVLILPDVMPELSKGGIAIPRTAIEKPITGLVVDCGPECDDVRKNTRVQYNRKAASIVTINNIDHHFIPESKIFFIYET